MGLTKSDSLRLKGVAMLMMFFHHLYCQVSRFDGYEISFAPFGQDAVVDVATIKFCYTFICISSLFVCYMVNIYTNDCKCILSSGMVF